MNLDPNTETNIAAGAAFLDERSLGWWEKIDFNNFNIAHGYHCVLGQVFGTYMTGQVSRN